MKVSLSVLAAYHCYCCGYRKNSGNSVYSHQKGKMNLKSHTNYCFQSLIQLLLSFKFLKYKLIIICNVCSFEKNCKLLSFNLNYKL